MLTLVCLPAGVAGVALLSIFITILYLTPLLPSCANSGCCLFIHHFSKPESSQGNKVIKVGDADIVLPCVYVYDYVAFI